MPELPEVETIRRQLAEGLEGAEVVGVTVRRASCYAGTQELAGEKIREVRRTGKYLFISFQSGRGFVIHLKMTGRLVLEVPWYEEAPHTRVIIELGHGRKLYYWDARTFGYVRVSENIAEDYKRQKARMGPEPWEISELEFYQLCQKYKRPIKNLILDQKLLAGVGNIYANDGLWEAEIDPRRAANKLTKNETKELLKAMKMVMERGLATGGASDNSYVDARGQRGSYQDEFRVYGRTKLPCLKCGKELKRVVVGGRGTWVCESCQK